MHRPESANAEGVAGELRTGAPATFGSSVGNEYPHFGDLIFFAETCGWLGFAGKTFDGPTRCRPSGVPAALARHTTQYRPRLHQ